MGKNFPIFPQTLKGRRGQLDARGSFLIGSIDRAAREIASAHECSNASGGMAFEGTRREREMC